MGKLGSALKTGQTAIELGQNAHNLAAAASEIRAMDKKDLGRQAGRHVFNEGTETSKVVGKTWLKTFEVVPRLICRGLQFVFAVIASGFYGHCIDVEHKTSAHISTLWIFAVVLAGASAITAVLFVALTPLGAIPFIGSRLRLIKTYRAFAWDLALCISWFVALGVFGGIFLKRPSGETYKSGKTGPMKIAVWVDLVNALLWMASGVYGAMKTFFGKKANQITDKIGQKLFERKKVVTKEDAYAESV
ncbi:hypothetical protein BGZ63DRAFT_415572 [Mariannaea sp. PMI_226]|nr:hypothetical protein BGZ63DRAFT_415572 [Mariannaea sp. PMI_226]